MAEQFVTVFTQMAMLFMIVAVGYICKKTNIMNATMDKGLSSIVLNAALPGMILGATLDAETLPTLEQLGVGALAALAVYAILLIMAFLVTFVLRIHPGNQGVFRYMIVFGNVGFIGYPVAQALFGDQSLIFVSIFQIPFNLLVYTVGIWMIVQDNEAGAKVKMSLKHFMTPCFISCVAAVILTIAGVHAVPLLGPACSTLGSMTTPASLIIIGSSLANLPVKELFGGFRLWVASAVRLLLTPVVVWFALHFFITDPLLLGVSVILCGMPVATNGTMLCYEYGGNPKTMAQGTFITTVFSMVTIPCLMMLLG